MSGLQEVIRHHDEAGARADAGRLVELGIGATVVHAPVASPTSPAPTGAGAAPDAGAGAGAGAADAPSGEGAAADGGGEVGEGEVATAEVGAWCVQVLAEDHARACELLGVEVPEPEEPTKPPTAPWKIILAIWLVAMIVIPLAAFWLTVNLAD